MRPALSAALSAVLPGLGQLANGERSKGLGVVSSAVGVMVGVGLAVWGPAGFRSWVTVVLLAGVYPFLWLPAVLDAWRGARGESTALLAGERIWYVLVLLATIGPMALPVLWQSPRFATWLKWLLSAVVVGIAVLAVVVALWLGPWIEAQLGLM